jgi:sugar lactone lactonase YvrE
MPAECVMPTVLLRITSVTPSRAVEGGRIVLHGTGFTIDDAADVRVGGEPARVLFASGTRLAVTVPAGLEGGAAEIRVGADAGDSVSVAVGGTWATGLHQVDNPVFDRKGDLFVTYSGSRGQEAPVSIFRVTGAGSREPFASGIVNATSMAFGPDELLYVSCRFEGAVVRVKPDGTHEQVASELGIACGVAFDADGAMYVGDRSGTVFRVREGRATPFATLPPSVAAFHLAMGPEDELFVSAPTLSSYDYVYRIDRRGGVRTIPTPFGRPQGLAFSPDGVLHVVDALAGSSGVYRFSGFDAAPELIGSGRALVGLAFGPDGSLVVTSNDTAYRF